MQEAVIRLLRATRKAMTATQVSQSLHIDRNSATRKLNKLTEFKMLKKTAFIDKKRHFGFRYRVI